MMDDPNLSDKYDAAVVGSESYNDTECWIVEMQAKVDDVAYQMRKLWVDKQRYIPLKEELSPKIMNSLNGLKMWTPAKLRFMQ